MQSVKEQLKEHIESFCKDNEIIDYIFANEKEIEIDIADKQYTIYLSSYRDRDNNIATEITIENGVVFIGNSYATTPNELIEDICSIISEVLKNE